MKYAAPRPGREWSARSAVICPSGSFVSSPFRKNISVFTHPKSHLELFASHPTTGAYRDRHGRGMGCGGRGSVLRATGSQGGSMRPVSDHQASGREMLQRTAKSCGPDTPTLVSSLRSCVGPTGLRQNISAGDGGKRARSPGRVRHKPLKPLRAGMPGDSGVLVYSCAFYQFKAHTRPRVRRAPGIPHALFRANGPCTTRAHCAAGTRNCI